MKKYLDYIKEGNEQPGMTHGFEFGERVIVLDDAVDRFMEMEEYLEEPEMYGFYIDILRAAQGKKATVSRLESRTTWLAIEFDETIYYRNDGRAKQTKRMGLDPRLIRRDMKPAKMYNRRRRLNESVDLVPGQMVVVVDDAVERFKEFDYYKKDPRIWLTSYLVALRAVVGKKARVSTHGVREGWVPIELTEPIHVEGRGGVVQTMGVPPSLVRPVDLTSMYGRRRRLNESNEHMMGKGDLIVYDGKVGVITDSHWRPSFTFSSGGKLAKRNHTIVRIDQKSGMVSHARGGTMVRPDGTYPRKGEWVHAYITEDNLTLHKTAEEYMMEHLDDDDFRNSPYFRLYAPRHLVNKYFPEMGADFGFFDAVRESFGESGSRRIEIPKNRVKIWLSQLTNTINSSETTYVSNTGRGTLSNSVYTWSNDGVSYLIIEFIYGEDFNVSVIIVDDDTHKTEVEFRNAHDLYEFLEGCGIDLTWVYENIEKKLLDDPTFVGTMEFARTAPRHIVDKYPELGFDFGFFDAVKEGNVYEFEPGRLYDEEKLKSPYSNSLVHSVVSQMRREKSDETSYLNVGDVVVMAGYGVRLGMVIGVGGDPNDYRIEDIDGGIYNVYSNKNLLDGEEFMRRIIELDRGFVGTRYFARFATPKLKMAHPEAGVDFGFFDAVKEGSSGSGFEMGEYVIYKPAMVPRYPLNLQFKRLIFLVMSTRMKDGILQYFIIRDNGYKGKWVDSPTLTKVGDFMKELDPGDLNKFIGSLPEKERSKYPEAGTHFGFFDAVKEARFDGTVGSYIKVGDRVEIKPHAYITGFYTRFIEKSDYTTRPVSEMIGKRGTVILVDHSRVALYMDDGDGLPITHEFFRCVPDVKKKVLNGFREVFGSVEIPGLGMPSDFFPEELKFVWTQRMDVRKIKDDMVKESVGDFVYGKDCFSVGDLVMVDDSDTNYLRGYGNYDDYCVYNGRVGTIVGMCFRNTNGNSTDFGILGNKPVADIRDYVDRNDIREVRYYHVYFGDTGGELPRKGDIKFGYLSTSTAGFLAPEKLSLYGGSPAKMYGRRRRKS